LNITRKHLRIFDIYEGKKDALNRIGTQSEKKMFLNGEFEKITELITKRAEKSSDFKDELNKNLNSYWNKKSISYLSKKYCEPEKEQSLFNNIMSLLWAMFG
jgi:hypothetical protein